MAQAVVVASARNKTAHLHRATEVGLHLRDGAVPLALSTGDRLLRRRNPSEGDRARHSTGSPPTAALLFEGQTIKTCGAWLAPLRGSKTKRKMSFYSQCHWRAV